MYSKQFLTISYLVITLVSFVVTGCGLKIFEQTKTKDTAEVKSIACLDSTIKDLKLYFAGDATDDQVTISIQCLQDVFVSFKENIRGENKDAFTAKEIAIFIETNFIKDGAAFSDKFLSELMNFKVALIGGDNQLIRKNEIDAIVRLFTILKPDLIRLNRSMKILNFKWTTALQPADADEKERLFLQAKSDLDKLIQRLSGEFIKTGNAYQLDDLLNFVSEILRFGKSEESTFDTIEKARPFIKKFKIILIGGDSSLADTEWSRLGSTLHEGLFQILRYQYFLKDLNETDTESRWLGYEKIAIDLSNLVENLLDAKETETLSNFELFEISQSLDKIFPELMMSMPLIDSIGHLKVMLLGDSPSGRIGWSKSDFSRLRIKIPQLFAELQVLVKTFEYLKGHQMQAVTWQTTEAEFQAVEADTLKAVAELAQLIERPYNIYYAKVLIEELSKGPFKDALILPENFESLFNVAMSVKTVLTGEEDNNIGVSNLKLLLKVGASAYLNFIEYDIFASPFAFTEAGFYPPAVRVFEKLTATIKLNLDLKTVPYYSTKELLQLILTLQAEKITTTTLTEPSLQAMFAGLWNNVLNNPADRINKKPLAGFDKTALAQFVQEGNIFLKTQMSLADIFSVDTKLTKAKLVEQLEIRMSQSNGQAKIGLKELLAFAKSVISLNFNDKGFLKILTADVGQYSLNDVIKSNLARAASRIIIRAYAADLNRVEKLGGVTLPEVEVAVGQFKGLAVDFGVIDPENTSFVSSRFLEANLFLGSSNGDQFAGFSEMHQLVIHILSGMSRADMLKEKIVKGCLPPQQGEINSKTGVWDECLLKVYYAEVDSYLDLPQFINLKKQFTETQIKDYYLSLLKAVGHVPNDKKVVYFKDADLFPHVVQYVEMVYARHDLNLDGVLEKCEALKAFPVFHDLIKELTKEYKLNEQQLPGVFIYLLKFGRPPKSLAEKLKFLSFINNPDKWEVRANRLDLGKIFNFIGESTTVVAPMNVLAPAVPSDPVIAPMTPLIPAPVAKPIVTGCAAIDPIPATENLELN